MAVTYAIASVREVGVAFGYGGTGERGVALLCPSSSNAAVTSLCISTVE